MGTLHYTTPQAMYSPNQSHPVQQHAPQLWQGPFGMNYLGHTLPDLSYQSYNQHTPQRYCPGPSSAAAPYHTRNGPQFANPLTLKPPAWSSHHNIPYQTQCQRMCAPGYMPSPQLLQSKTHTGNQLYYGYRFTEQPQQSWLSCSRYGPHIQGYSTSPSAAQLFSQDSSREARAQASQRANEYLEGGCETPIGSSSIASNSSHSLPVVRGPPRKPRQREHTIWIGNLPSQTNLMSLVFHIYKESPGLESVFLMSKSNCAFANFEDEATCATAQLKIHDSKFQAFRLVSRLRVNRNFAPRAPAALTAPSAPTLVRNSPSSNTKAEEENVQIKGAQESEENSSRKDRFFVMKSLTVQDLERSISSGIWATQSHNEEALNKAYESADNVYLIFSANKSGNYFGYARMICLINDNDDLAAAIKFAPKAQAAEDLELPKAISTSATEFAPKGCIIDDSARGTIFWEADRHDGECDLQNETRSDRSHQRDSPPRPNPWGKPFKVKWISTTRVPFYRTRGLRNPWNLNREVKIARDGTELETSIGRRLVALFHRLPSPGAPAMTYVPCIPVYFAEVYPQT